MIRRILEWFRGSKPEPVDDWIDSGKIPRMPCVVDVDKAQESFTRHPLAEPYQDKSNMMYVRELRAKRQAARENGIPPMTPEQEEQHLRLVRLRNRVDALDTLRGVVYDFKVNRHE